MAARPGSDEAPPARQLDPLACEAEQRGQEGEGGGNGDRHHRGGADGEALHEADAHDQHAEQ